MTNYNTCLGNVLAKASQVTKPGMYTCMSQLDARRKRDLSLKLVPLGVGMRVFTRPGMVAMQCFASFRS